MKKDSVKKMRGMKRVVFIMIALAVLTGCYTSRGSWKKDGVSNESLMQDYSECRKKAFGPFRAVGHCMEERGYVWESR